MALHPNTKPRTYPLLNDVDRAWVAGFLEGEGSFIATHAGGARVIRITASSIDRDVLERLQAITGVGNINLNYPAKGNHHACWIWQVARRADVCAMMRDIYPLMGVRRQHRILRCLAFARHGWGWDALPSSPGVRAAVQARWSADDIIADSAT